MEIQPDFKELLGLFNAQVGREQFIINKKAAARKKDLADLEALGEEYSFCPATSNQPIQPDRSKP
jgi:hypothetical protein